MAKMGSGKEKTQKKFIFTEKLNNQHNKLSNYLIFVFRSLG